VPDGKARIVFAPILVGKAEIEIGQRAADRNMADVASASASRSRLASTAALRTAAFVK